MKDRIKKYWVIGENFTYDIRVTDADREPDARHYGTLDGPFQTLTDAKRHARSLIANDRATLQHELVKITQLKVSDLLEG